jgi:hypothetical protein
MTDQYVETSLENLGRKISQALRLEAGDNIIFSKTRGGHVLLQKEQETAMAGSS